MRARKRADHESESDGEEKKGKNEPKTHTRAGDSWGTSSCSQFKPSILGNRRFDSSLQFLRRSLTLHVPSSSPSPILLLLLLDHHLLLLLLLPPGARTCLREKREIATAKHSRRDLASHDVISRYLCPTTWRRFSLICLRSHTGTKCVAHGTSLIALNNSIPRQVERGSFLFLEEWGEDTVRTPEGFFPRVLDFDGRKEDRKNWLIYHWWVRDYFINFTCPLPSKNRCNFFIN